ncbi:MAG: PKD domain-containing protein [Candidatus Paceibacterota bacterium]
MNALNYLKNKRVIILFIAVLSVFLISSTAFAASCGSGVGTCNSGTPSTPTIGYTSNEHSTGTYYAWDCSGVGATVGCVSTPTYSTTVICTGFTYTNWGACQSNNTQTRGITAQAPTGCSGGSPATTRSCVYNAPVTTCSSFNYSSWSACQSNNTQTRTVTFSSPSGCTGGNPLTTQSCTYIPQTPTAAICGSANGSTMASFPSGSPTLCSSGAPSTNTTIWNYSGGAPVSSYFRWTCTAGSAVATCASASSPLAGACGSAAGGTFLSTPTSGLCNAGTPSAVAFDNSSTIEGKGTWSNVYSWTCDGGTSTPITWCYAYKQPTVNPSSATTCSSFTYSAWGACQSNNTQTRSVIGSSPSGCTGGSPYTVQSCNYTPTPTTCTSFDYSAWGACQSNNTQTRSVIGSSPSGCVGGNPITTQSCSYAQPQNGVCGSANGQSFVSAPTANLCIVGTTLGAQGLGPWTWTCNGSNGGANVQCNANKTYSPTPINGQCGSANGQSFVSTPQVNLCNTGDPINFNSFSYSWTWNCSGQNGGSDVSCSANRTNTSNPINGQCGSAAGNYFTYAPSGNLCNSGNAISFTGSGPWTWYCTGQNGGSDVNCMAYKNQTNFIPNVDAGDNKNVQSGQSVYMNATASDPQGYSLNYSWNCNGGSLSSYNILNPTFYAPMVSSGNDLLYFCNLTVTNTVGATNSDGVNITVRNSGYNNNNPPTVYAGNDKNIPAGGSVYMNATASDPQGSYLTYSWNCNGGTLSSYNILNPTYYAPNINYNNSNSYACTITVYNNRGQSASSSVNIQVGTNYQPVSYSNLAVSTYDATSITTKSAALNGRLDGDNGNPANVRFAYGRGNSLNLTTLALSNKRAGQRFYITVNNLEKAKAYSFRAEATGSNGAIVYGNTLKFMTAPDEPLYFNGSLSGNGVNLTWLNGEGACYTVITRKLNSYPVTATDGVAVYFGTGTNYFDSDVLANKNYYYRAWSVGCDEGMYSWSTSVNAKKYVSTNGMGGQTVQPYVPAVVIPRAIVLNITGRNITQNGQVTNGVVYAKPGDEIAVSVVISSSDGKALQSVLLKNTLPENIDSVSNVRLDNKFYGGDINGTILIGTIPANTSKTLTFVLKVAPVDECNPAVSTLVDMVEVNAKGVETVKGSLTIDTTGQEQSTTAASIGLFANGWWNLLWLLIGLIIGLIIFLLIYIIVKRMNEKKQLEAVPVFPKDKYFSIQQ